MEPPVRQHFLYDLVLPRVEVVGWPLAGLGLALRLAGIPAGSMLLIVGLGTLALVFFLRAYEPKTDGPAPIDGLHYEPVTLPAGNVFSDLIAPKIQNIASAVALIGVLFKLLLWHGSGAMLPIGLLTLVPLATWQLFTRQLSWRAALVTALALGVWLVPTETLIRQFYGDDPALVERMIYQQEHPRDRAAAQQVQELLKARRERLRAR